MIDNQKYIINNEQCIETSGTSFDLPNFNSSTINNKEVKDFLDEIINKFKKLLYNN